jgi:DNA-directed RNA polymerase specialized sigma24 family protein
MMSDALQDRDAAVQAEGIPEAGGIPATIHLRAMKDRRAEEEEYDPDLWLYRDRTVAVLQRYLRFSVEVGRLPSLVGREFFRTRAISYQVLTFEDAVILVHDVEKDLARLEGFDKELIAKCVLQEYTQDEAARLLQCWRRTVSRRLPEALDHLSALFLRSGLLRRMGATRSKRRKKLSRGQNDENPGK